VVYGLIFINIVTLVAGQTLFKLGFNKLGAFSLHTLVPAFLSPFILAGLALYVIATLLWFAILSRVQLSIAYPLQSLAYVLGLIVSVTILHERVTLLNWVGTGVILIGVVLLSVQARL